MKTSSKSIVLALLVAFTANAGDLKCNATARECDQQIRQMLSGPRYLGVTIEQKDSSLSVKSVDPEGPAAKSGVREGDRLIAVNGNSLTRANIRDFKQIIAHARSTGRLRIIVMRRGAYVQIVTRLVPYSKEQINKIITAHLSQSHTSTAGAN